MDSLKGVPQIDYPGGMEQKCTTVTFRIFPEAEIGLCPKWQKPTHRLCHRFDDRSGILALFWCRLGAVSPSNGGSLNAFQEKSVSGTAEKWKSITSPP